MYTQCPRCKTLFRVAAGQLGAAQGQVRCSKCLAVFNALQQLYEQLPTHLREEFLRTPERRTAATSTPTGEGARSKGPPGSADAARRSVTPPTQTDPRPEVPAAPVQQPPAADAHTPAVSATSLLRRTAVLTAQQKSAAQPGDEAAVIHPPSARATVGWSLGIVVLLIVLAGQWVWIMREDLAGNAALRPWLERMCELGGCRLPPRRELGAIVLSDRDVRSHPRVDSALLINATIVNKAGFAQPYPRLELALSNTAGNVVASRVFRAEEYLGRSLAPGELMPVGVPINITLELADPGKSAVGFAFEFR